MRNFFMCFIFIAFIFNSCDIFELSVSETRSPEPYSYILKEDTEITSWGAVLSSKVDFFPSSFRIRNGQVVIYIDPIGITDSVKADYIFLTHAHPDHFSIEDIRKLLKPNTVIVASRLAARKILKYGYAARIVYPGDTVNLGPIQCKAVAAYNTKPVFLWIKAHPKSKENVGYILSLHDSIRLYHAGDTDLIPEMDAIENITVALIPIGGDNLTMNVEEAIKIVNKIKPEVVIPMHYELRKTEDLERFKNSIEEGIHIKIME